MFKRLCGLFDALLLPHKEKRRSVQTWPEFSPKMCVKYTGCTNVNKEMCGHLLTNSMIWSSVFMSLTSVISTIHWQY